MLVDYFLEKQIYKGKGITKEKELQRKRNYKGKSQFQFE
jgi:hypothetical protein